MNKNDCVIIFIIVTACLFYIQKLYNEVKYVKSSVDDNKYLVQNKIDKETAANMLANLNKKIKTLLAHVKENFGDKDGVTRLLENYDENNISEGNEDTNYTSYSVNKGEKIVFCLRQRNSTEEFVDENVLMYVATHELGHLMTKEIGHTKTFWDNFKFLLLEAEKIGVYKKVDYSEHSAEYCGLNIQNSII